MILQNFLGLNPWVQNSVFPMRALLGMAASFWARPRTLEGLRHIIALFLQESVYIDGYQAGFQLACESDYSYIGKDSSALGRTSVLGRRLWNMQYCLNIRIHISDEKKYMDMRPSGETFQNLSQLCKGFLGGFQKFRFCFVRSEGGSGARLSSVRLGYTSWLNSRQEYEPSTYVMGR